ncbi:putative holin-like toxin [Mediterraneibacter massiliensis]|uniref:putative holin-like toxin n=1 Tax=Mediterraneibacter massiliensis TaxID=1720300 RepID=UPI003A7F2C04
MSGQLNRIMCLTRQLGGRIHPFRSLAKGVVLMSTYEEFQIIISVAILIVAILNYLKNDHKK